MELDDALIDRLAELSRLEFNAEEKKAIRSDLGKILSFMEKLNELDTEGVDPMIYVSDNENVFREDGAHGELPREEVLRNAPMKDSDYIKVPKVISQGD